jgi:small GTP-binding protein
MENKKENNTFKMVLLGPPMAGKSKLVTNLAYGGFSEEYKRTISAGFEVIVPSKEEKPQKKFLTWDVSGAEKFGSIREPALTNAHIILLVIDATSVMDGSAQEKLQPFIDLINEKSTLAPEAKIALVITKSDLVTDDKKTEFNAKSEELASSIKDNNKALSWMDKTLYCSAKATEDTNIYNPKKVILPAIKDVTEELLAKRDKQDKSTQFNELRKEQKKSPVFYQESIDLSEVSWDETADISKDSPSSPLENMSILGAAGLVVGAIVGAGVGIFLFYALVPLTAVIAIGVGLFLACGAIGAAAGYFAETIPERPTPPGNSQETPNTFTKLAREQGAKFETNVNQNLEKTLAEISKDENQDLTEPKTGATVEVYQKKTLTEQFGEPKTEKPDGYKPTGQQPK